MWVFDRLWILGVRSFSTIVAVAMMFFTALVVVPTVEYTPRFNLVFPAPTHHVQPLDTRKPTYTNVDRLMLHGRLPLHV